MDTLYSRWVPSVANINDDSTTDIFESDEVFLDGNAATKSFTLDIARVHYIYLRTVTHYLDPTNAETYTLYLLADNPAPAIEEVADLLFQSPAGRADSVGYIETGNNSSRVPIAKKLETASTIFMKVDWSGAPGNTNGVVHLDMLVYV